MITTKRPTDDMIEVAIVSMEEALSADGEAIPTGSTDLDRDPMKLAPTAEPDVQAIEPTPVAPTTAPTAPSLPADPPPGT
jgi:hypothetical protein